MSQENQYFANLPSRECVANLFDKIDTWQNRALTSGLIEKIQRSWSYYYGSFYDDIFSWGNHTLSPSGDQGELLRFPVNHYRNIGQHMLNLTTANRPAMQARAVNADYKSLAQTRLANGLLDYYMREKGLEDIIKQSVEYAIVGSEGFIKMEWDATAGEQFGYNEDLKTFVYEGDIKYKALTTLDVIRDVYKTDSFENDWLIVRSFKNRYDLAAKFPDLKEEILRIETKDKDFYRYSGVYSDSTDLIPIYEFYHRRSDAVPDGRYILFVSSEAIPLDQALPYRDIPVYRVAHSNMMGTPFGYANMFDLLPVQEAINLLYSVVMTNQNAFGVQNVLVPKGSDINLSQIVGGLNILEYLPGMDKPQALNLTNTPAEIFNHINKLESVMETLSGINQVIRGNPEASLRSGNALAMIQAQAIQFASGLQQSYVRVVESVGTATIKMLQDYAEAPRVAAIVGKENQTYLQDFTGNDLSSINRVVVDVTNPVSKTTAGKVQIADNLLQYKMVKTPEQYFQVLSTGQLDTLTSGVERELLLISNENEMLMGGEDVIATALDSHSLHIKEHRTVLYNPDLRKDPTLVQNVLAHIQEHLDLAKQVDPAILQMIGEPVFPPEQQGAPGAGQVMEAPPGGVEEAQNAAMPQMPDLPESVDGMPLTGSAAMNNLTGG